MAAENTPKKARKQLSQPVGPQRSENSSGTTYNIWYNKNAGERGHSREKAQATTRCNIAKDSGTSKGSSRDWDGTFICLKFSRGCCPLGYDCSWIHTLPSGEFESNLEATKDCFGRERHEHVRDDQSGVGAFSADEQTARTLYVETAPMRSSLKKPWQNQALDNNEILNVRWATDDPNPWVLKRKVESSKEKLATAILQDYDGPLRNAEGCLPPQKRQYKGRELQEHEEAVGYYPNTDYQYSEVNASSSLKSDTQAIQSHANPALMGFYSTASDSQPKTLSDLIKWSKEQASLNRATELPHLPVKQLGKETTEGKKSESGGFSLVSAYDSSSDDEDEDNS
ncbi:Pre-mRNA-splicing factor [Desmophyllum pertusum]|uniref:Pre-mRNA-splicing factor n=1 Tax=Desmophyllum pertusum TaxID=174260 RepID=A0A9X0CRC5_9CNID|nr:Pre-mRNA-splicing factor [Desmophyllum pertusum]